MKAPVTRKHLVEGVPSCSTRCALQLALHDKGYKFVTVDLQRIRGTKDGIRKEWWTPREGQLAILAFDSGQTVKPFNLDLEAPVRTWKAASTRTGDARKIKRARHDYEARGKARGKRRSTRPHITKDRVNGLHGMA